MASYWVNSPPGVFLLNTGESILSAEKHKSTYEWAQQIRSTTEKIDGIEMDEIDRKTIYRCLSAELVEANARWNDLVATERDGRRWSEEDIDKLKNFLKGKRPKSWEEERNVVFGLAAHLRRSEKPCRKKAIELGLQHAVDYWVNR